MDQNSKVAKEAVDELPLELIELGRRLSELRDDDRRDINPIYNQVVDSVRRRRRILALVQDAVSELRLDVKYLMFDLEVTRRERDALRERLGGD